MSCPDSNSVIGQPNLQRRRRYQPILTHQSQVIHWRYWCQRRQKSFAKWRGQHRHWNSWKIETNDWKEMAFNEPCQTYHLGRSRWNDQWIPRSNEGHFCWTLNRHSSLLDFCYHAKGGPVNHWAVYEGADQDPAGEEGSTSERNQAVLRGIERQQPKVWYSDSSLQESGNRSVHSVRKHQGKGPLIVNWTKEHQIPDYKLDWRHAWRVAQGDHAKVQRRRSPSVGINGLNWSRNWHPAS